MTTLKSGDSFPSDVVFQYVNPNPPAKNDADLSPGTFHGTRKVVKLPPAASPSTTMPRRSGPTRRSSCSPFLVSLCRCYPLAKGRMLTCEPRCFHPDLFCQPRARIYPEPAQAPREGCRHCRGRCFQRSIRDECLGQGERSSRG